MDERVSPHVEGVRPCPPHKKHVHNAAVPMDTGIVQGRKPMLIPEGKNKVSLHSQREREIYLRNIDVILRVHGPLLAVKLIPITTGRENILTGCLWTQALQRKEMKRWQHNTRLLTPNLL